MRLELFFQRSNFNIDLSDPDLHIDPDGNDGDEKAEQRDRLAQGHSEDCGFCFHGCWMPD
jgi:hypothetical protein